MSNHETLYGCGPVRLAFQSDEESALEGLERQPVGCEGPILLEHSLRVLDFRHQLREECSKHGVTLVEWLAEAECLHEFEFRVSPYSAWETILIKPDTSFELAVDGQSHRFFLEVDLGHVSLPRYRKKLQRYQSYAGSGAFRDAYDTDGFTVLTVTTGERRLDHLSELPVEGFAHILTTWSRIAATELIASERDQRGVANCLFQAVHAKNGMTAR